MKHILYLFCASILLLAACQSNSKEEGDFLSRAEKTESGMRYFFHKRDTTARKVQVGDYISYHNVIATESDSIIADTRLQNPLPQKEKVYPISQKGYIDEMLPMLHKGDSVSIWVSTDSLAQRNGGQLPPYLRKGSWVKFVLHIIDVQTEEEMQQEFMGMQKKQEEEFEQRKGEEQKLIKEYIEKNKLEAKSTASGLHYVITKASTGASPKANDSVSVHYVGKLLDGKEFDNSLKRGEPIEFTLGQGMVIPGWDEGIALLKKGEKALLIIPSGLAYGPRGAGDMIPPNSILLFEVELVDFK
jgi:FKBP-type peptidyl-prolyl cis-trans isomerase